MKKFTKNDYINLAILIGFFLLMVFLLTKSTYLYGSKTDYESQHWLFADYFRTLFYKTGNLFPNLAPHIGAGQNIYNFAYYGFLNPIILFSYLLPFVKMIDYLAISMIILIIASIILFYKFLLNHNYSSKLSLFTTFIFLCASPLIFHSHRHVMFINYMPFLILGFMGVDNFFDKNKKSLLLISIFLIIMTSYYYSVCSIIVLTIYGIFKYLSKKEISAKDFLKNGLSFSGVIISSICMAGILLLPVASVILNGRTVKTAIDISSILTPNLNIDYLLYGNYAIGLTAICIPAIIHTFTSKERNYRLIGWSILVITLFPIINYVLNGTLYLNAKVFIPFLPLICLLIAHFIDDLINHRVNIKNVTIINIMVIIMTFITNRFDNYYLYLIDNTLVISFILLYHYKKLQPIIIIISFIIPIITAYNVNISDTLIKKDDFEISFDNKKYIMINDIIKNDPSFYRFNDLTKIFPNTNHVYNGDYYLTSLYSSTYNTYYNNYYNSVINNNNAFRNSLITSNSNNILFQTIMGVKYIIVNGELHQGYDLVATGKYHIYQNKTAYALGYVTDKIISKNDFDQIKYPYTIDALLDYAIINENVISDYQSHVEEINLETKIKKSENITITKNDDIIEIDSKDDGYLKLDIIPPLENKILLISFEMLLSQKCRDGDTMITINGVSNKLTCKEWKYHNNNYDFHYVINYNETRNLVIHFTKGHYKINNIKTYTLDYQHLEESYNSKDMMQDIVVGNDMITGKINASKNGYFIITLPYDKGYTIYLDNKKIDYELVNESFMGFKINKGNHQIKITYNAPMKNIGTLLSICGILMLGVYLFNDYKGVCLWKKFQSLFHVIMKKKPYHISTKK